MTHGSCNLALESLESLEDFKTFLWATNFAVHFWNRFQAALSSCAGWFPAACPVPTGVMECQVGKVNLDQQESKLLCIVYSVYMYICVYTYIYIYIYSIYTV